MNGNGTALGLIETQGLVGLINAVDAMLKAASVELASSIIKLDGGLVSVMVRGDVSSVRAAVEAGAEAAGRVGELKAAHVIPRPGDRIVQLSPEARDADMKILVANLGSTSFKYRLYDLGDRAEHAARPRGGRADRLGQRQGHDPARPGARSSWSSRSPTTATPCRSASTSSPTPRSACSQNAADVAAIGFKAVHARDLTGVQLVDEDVLEAMEAFADVAPAHNPPYIKAMRMLGERFPELPLVAAFETGFHRTIPEANQRYAIPEDWATELGIRRWGFHGASHRYIAGRMAELLGRDDLKVISCHLGGSSSLCAIRDGKSVACSLGMSPQSGLPHNNRVGDFDVFALPVDPPRDRPVARRGPRHPGQQVGPRRV